MIVDVDRARAAEVVGSLGDGATWAGWDPAALTGGDVVLIAAGGPHAEFARAALDRSCDVVSTSDDLDDVRELLALDGDARERGRTVVVGAGFAPGLSCVLAKHAAGDMSTVDEIHVASVGTGGPACARQHHNALRAEALDWRDGEWVHRRAGSGRELCWFPDPVGGTDCYRAAAPDALLLEPAFPHVRRVTARVGATRRDRLTARLPMLRRPHPEGLMGAVRVEVRGSRGAARDVRVLGVLDRPAMAAGAVAAVAARAVAAGQLARTGAAGLAEMVEHPVAFLRELSDRGVRAAVFDPA